MTSHDRLKMILPLVLVLLLAGCYPVPAPIALSGGTPAAPLVLNATPTKVLPPATPQTGEIFPSPDGRWRAEVVIYPCVETGEGKLAFEELRLTDARDTSTSIVDFQLRNCEGLGAFGLAGLFWSRNSRYFYYTDAREGSPDGGCAPWVPPTVRLDAETHDVVRMGNGPLSPDKTRIATWQDAFLVIWDLERGNGDRVKARVEGAVPGLIAWSPDGVSLAYLQTASMCPPTGASHVTLVDADLSQEALLDTGEPGFVGLDWETDSTLRLASADDKAWRLDVESRKLTPVD